MDDSASTRSFNQAIREQAFAGHYAINANDDGDPTGGTTPLGEELRAAEAELDAATARNDSATVALLERKLDLLMERARLQAAERALTESRQSTPPADFGGGVRGGGTAVVDMNAMIRATRFGVAERSQR